MIEIKDLVKIYGNKKVLNGVSLQLKQKKRTTIIGQSGCGKSTLLRLILGLEDFESGDIIIDEKSIKDLGLTDITSFDEADFKKIKDITKATIKLIGLFSILIDLFVFLAV